MCIRDRVKYERSEDEKIVSFDPEVTTYMLPRYRKTNQSTSITLKPIAVSYTHLDVYKRQELGLRYHRARKVYDRIFPRAEEYRFCRLSSCAGGKFLSERMQMFLPAVADNNTHVKMAAGRQYTGFINIKSLRGKGMVCQLRKEKTFRFFNFIC